MASERSLSDSMDNAKKHYSSLFFLPSFRRSLASSALTCIVGVSLTAMPFFPAATSLVFGALLFAVTFLSDLLVSRILLRGDPIFVMRRTSAVSFYNWLLWLAFIAIGAGLGIFLGSTLWIKFTLLGLGAVSTLRFIVFFATSTSQKWKQIISALMQPLLCITVFYGLWYSNLGVMPYVLLFIGLAPIISFAAVHIFLKSIDRLGQKMYGLPGMPLFRSFLLNWVTDANAPLESYLEEMGENSDIDISLLKFESAKPNAAIIVPLVHPGPFKNIGSSLLPSLLKHEFEKEYSCPTCIPLGILGHELDLASQAQNHKIIDAVISSAKTQAKSAEASPFIRETDGTATASCQIFGDTAFLSFSLAPRTTEDLPQELGLMVTEEAKKYGLKHAVVVNAHNCLDEIDDTVEHIDELKSAAIKCLRKVASLPKKPFKLGAATLLPKEFTEKQGMGTGGITTIVVEVDRQRTAYVVIDGNNMVPHLREKIINSLNALGFDECEVFTTDTHAVSALVLGKRGYHPVGEAMDHDILIKHITETADTAAQNLEPTKTECIQLVVQNVRVIGEERLDSMSNLVDKAIGKAKKIVAPIFGVEGLLLVLLLLLF